MSVEVQTRIKHPLVAAMREAELERARARLAALEKEFEGWAVAIVEMAELRNRIRKMELGLL